MKPALFYAVSGTRNPQIVAVTSETRSGLRRKWHGRYVSDNTPTHGKFGGHDDIKGRFTTVEEAQGCIADLKRITAKYQRLREPHQDAISDLYRQEREEIKGLTRVQEVA